MPAHLCHGFRWHRPAIRIFVIVHDLEDASPDWTVGPATSRAILGALYEAYDFLPVAASSSTEEEDEDEQEDEHAYSAGKGKGKGKEREEYEDDDSTGTITPIMSMAMTTTTGVDMEMDDDDNDDDNENENIDIASWSAIHLLEEYDPLDQATMSRPYAYVADRVVRVDLGVSVTAEMARYEAEVAALPVDQRPVTLSHAHDNDDNDDDGLAEKMDAVTMYSPVMAPPPKPSGWFEKLRDGMQKDEEIGWFVVSCEDEEREWPEEERAERRMSEEGRAVLDELRRRSEGKATVKVIVSMADDEASSGSGQHQVMLRPKGTSKGQKP